MLKSTLKQAGKSLKEQSGFGSIQAAQLDDGVEASIQRNLNQKIAVQISSRNFLESIGTEEIKLEMNKDAAFDEKSGPR